MEEERAGTVAMGQRTTFGADGALGSDGDTLLLIRDVGHRAHEYQEGARLLRLLLSESLCVSPSQLSPDGAAALRALTHSAAALHAKDTSLPTLLSALSSRDRGRAAEERRSGAEQRRLRRYGEQLAALQRLEAALSAAAQRPDPGPIARRCCPTQRLRDKAHDIGARIRSAQGALRALRMEEGWTHAALVGQAEELARADRAAVALRKELDAFLDLPPNIALARVKVAEAQRELESLEEELAQRIEALSRRGSPAP